MFFRRNEGEFRETDRVTRFKLIKSGKNWLRAATSNFGLFKVVKGGADAPSVSVQNVEEKSSLLSGTALLKGIAAAGAVAGGAVATYTAQAEETSAPALESQATTNHDIIANSDSVALSAAPVSETVASEAPASASQESTSSSVDAQASTDASVSVSQSVSAELSQAISESVSLSKVNSTSESQSHTESNSGSHSESSSASESATSTAATASETATQEDEKTILDQNVSEAELLVGIAKDYQAKLTDTAAKAEIQTAIATVQEEVVKSTTLLAASATNAAYAEQRERLGNAVDNMMTKITDNGFTGNSVVNGVAAVTAQLAPISTSTTGSVDTIPVISNPNGATIEDAAFNEAGYALDPNADRFTFGVWQFLKTNHATGAKTNFDYYATLSVDRSAITGSLSANPDVYLRIVKKSDGSEVYTRTIKAGESNISLPSYITNNNSDVTNTLTYKGANGTDPGNVTFSLVNANLEYETLQIRDTNYPGNVGEDKPNVQTSVPYATVDQTTHYKLIQGSSTPGQLYKPTGNETDLASYTQTGLAGQQFTASGNRDILGYKHVAATTDSTQKTSGILGKGVVGQKLVELQGGANHYYVKRISEIVDTEGSTVTKFYALDPSQVSNFTSSDVGTEDVSKYTLIYTSKVNKAGEEWKADESKVTRVNSKNGDYHIDVTETAGSKSLVITGWFSNTEKVNLTHDETKLTEAFDKPFTGAPDASLTPAGQGNNKWNLIAGRNADIVADSKVTQPDGSITYTNLKGYTSFSNNYSIPSAVKPSTDVNYYFEKLGDSESASQSQSFSNSVSNSQSESEVVSKSQSVSESEVVSNSKSQSESEVVSNSQSVSQSESEVVSKSQSVSQSESASASKSASASESASSSESTSVSESVSASESYSASASLSESTSTSTSVSESLSSSESTSASISESMSESETPKVGEVIITYIRENDGKEIQKPRQDTPNSPYDTPYNTTEEGEKPNTIKTPDGKTYKIVPKGDYPVGKVDGDGHLESSDPIKGKVDKPKSTITYVYKEVKGDVYVHYKDTDGNTIKTSVVDEKDQPVDKDYDTVIDNRPKEIQYNGKTYELVPAGNYNVGKVDEQGHLESSDATTGKVIEGRKDVTYIYKLKEQPAQPKGNVYVHYVDTDGNTIKASVTDEKDQPVGKDYDTVVDNRPKEIEFQGKTYELVPAGNYKVGQVDEQGHWTGDDATTGKVVEGDKNVTYVYKLKEDPTKPKEGDVIITYVDEKGKEIKKPRQDTPNSPYDTPYNTTEEGEKPNTIKTPDGKTYKIVPKGDYPVGKVDGDGHLESSDPIKGKVDKPRSIITYVYKEVKGDVYVHYKDTEGNTIKTSVVDEKDQPVDKDYDTVVDNRPKTITTTDGKVYELVPAGNYTVGKVDGQGHLESSDATTGKVIEGRKDVTYIYKLKEQPAQPKGNVYVHYVDENGNTIKQSVTDEFGQPVGKDYDTVIDNRPKTIVTADGKVYELVPQGNYPVGSVDGDGHLTTTDPVTGKVIEGDKNVTYVYKLVDTTPEKPVTPTPGKPEQPTPGKPVDPAPKAPAKATPVKPAQEMAQLPNTGEESNVAATAALGLLATASGLALAAKRKKTEE